VAPGDRVAIMLEPSLAFYAALFGAIKRGAIAVPLFTLFGADGVRLRVRDCTPRLLVTNAEKADTARGIKDLDVVVADDATAGLAGGLFLALRGCAAHRTTSPSSSTRPAPRASCPPPCGTRTGPSSCS
jgi:acyl-coenzyme A synthetase/AMP-(fatty) acid ligase